MAMPNIGLIKVVDSESGFEKWIDTSYSPTRIEYEKWWATHVGMIKNIFRHCGVDETEVSTGEDYVKPLIKLFKNR
jgi:LPS sulfotransferase NodH